MTTLILMGTDEVMAAYGIRAYPTTYLIEADGVVRFQRVGEFTASMLDSALAKLGLDLFQSTLSLG